MKIYIPQYSGFCPGVKLAEKKILNAKETHPKQNIEVIGPLIHNHQYIDFLESQGIETVDDETCVKNGALGVIRTHGMDKFIEGKIREKVEVLDLTCNKVKKIQKDIENHSKAGFFIVITGKRDHPEVIGLISYAKECVVIEKEADISDFIDKKCLEQKINKILVLSQSTGNRGLFEKTAQSVQSKCGKESEVKVIDTICSITSLREKEASEMQKKAEITFVVGDRMSANANKLYEILKKNQDKTYFVDNLDELKALDIDLKQFKSALVVSSSSTPDFIEKQVIEYLAAI